MLLLKFPSTEAATEFFTRDIRARRLTGSAWSSGDTVVILSADALAISAAAQEAGADAVTLYRRPMHGQVLRDGRVVDQRVCAKCGVDFTHDPDRTCDLEAGLPHDTVVCQDCVLTWLGVSPS